MSTIVVSRIDDCLLWECIELLDALIEHLTRSPLKVCAASFSDEECISRKEKIADMIRGASTGMSWRRECSDTDITELESVLVSEEDVRLGYSCSRSHHNLGSGRSSELSTRSDVIRMDVRIEDIVELQSELPDEIEVTVDLVFDRVDDRSFFC